MSNTDDINLNGGENAVLLIHGLSGSPFEMNYLAKKLHKEGFSVSVPCLAGHGSSLSDLSNASWKDWHKSILNTFHILKETHDKVFVSGLCMGAVLALYTACELGSEVSAISLMSTTLFYDGWSIPWYRIFIPLAYYTPLRYFYSYREKEPYGIKNALLRKHVVRLMNEKNIAHTKIPFKCFYELLEFSKMVRKLLPKIEIPTLILHSLEDDVASIRNADFVEKNIGSDRVRKILIDDCYHMITVDNKRELVSQETINFFNEHI
ncbi:MAG: hypothetical protein A3G31_07335 [Candidatus Schekmanbacteria bacterium RIFCSPLOWO2_12_FULL_38_15]|uniref:Serine aminopeptidase S33 domain-containing protein n=1 Tax=Candidatus Schekmanbacteria bacterium RIFCSPLOWO2_12_FULL_38_15 TaxID=1817883 RepID=A0A1F7SHN7_9BACT|nr:MAG: hypothetical protein A3G31_07335 [Candidatus Schekmanbacteria bacterium RIFCSPLOWO2_12_FULL_38_15]